MDAGEMFDALSRALDLETEGYEFYMRCAENTKSKEGQEMFRYLAEEEQTHYKKVKEIFKNEFRKEFEKYEGISEEMGQSGVFEEKVPGGNLDEKSDALDALNIAIKAEVNSIELYEKLAEGSSKPDIKNLFEKLAEEEKKHRSILEAEVEFVTETGEFHDFKAVTM